ncbi:MAG: tRNA pseudouridine(54/55) synthase Pus10 [Planctomycetota bacterium]
MSGRRDSLFFESRYRKLVRDLPQTIFWCPTCKGSRKHRVGCETCEGLGKLSEDSVQELVARRILPAFRARRGKFHGAGREDIDVRMLGRGRPFVFEIEGPRYREADLEDVGRRIQDQEAGRIEIEPFRPVGRERVAALKEGRFWKRYRVGVACDGAFDAGCASSLAGTSWTLAQRTPARVAHRRADLVRARQVRLLAVRVPAPEGDFPLEVDVDTAHGTYVKEWVSGDEGRTEPSLAALLGVPATCSRLDVLEILDDPDAISAES